MDDGDSLAAKSQSSGGSISSEVVVQRTGDIGGKSSASKLTNIFRSAPKVPWYLKIYNRPVQMLRYHLISYDNNFYECYAYHLVYFGNAYKYN